MGKLSSLAGRPNISPISHFRSPRHHRNRALNPAPVITDRHPLPSPCGSSTPRRSNSTSSSRRPIDIRSSPMCGPTRNVPFKSSDPSKMLTIPSWPSPRRRASRKSRLVARSLWTKILSGPGSIPAASTRQAAPNCRRASTPCFNGTSRLQYAMPTLTTSTLHPLRRRWPTLTRTRTRQPRSRAVGGILEDGRSRS